MGDGATSSDFGCCIWDASTAADAAACTRERRRRWKKSGVRMQKSTTAIPATTPPAATAPPSPEPSERWDKMDNTVGTAPDEDVRATDAPEGLRIEPGPSSGESMRKRRAKL
jgi:hypothetical protein